MKYNRKKNHFLNQKYRHVRQQKRKRKTESVYFEKQNPGKRREFNIEVGREPKI